MSDSTNSPVRQRYTPEQVAEALHRSRGLVSVAARALDCDPGTVKNYIKRYVSVAKAKDEARDGILDLGEARLFQAVDRGEPWAVSLMLKTLGKARGYVERAEVTGADGEAVTIKVVYGGIDNPSAKDA